MINSGQAVRTGATDQSIVTFAWRDLRLQVVTREPLSADQVRAIEGMAGKVPSVGVFADLVGMVVGRHIRVRSERPSREVRLEVGP